ncbi:MAG: NUDIX hydrolase [Sulfuritalea sp.]|nr:NUDIX hydrolase [Sulfuritalea sp.]
MNRVWKPNVTVAAVVERDGRFLLVEEETEDGLRFNQPAGHLDEGESLLAACAREALEETAWNFTPTALVGVYQWPRPRRGGGGGGGGGGAPWKGGGRSSGNITYLRFAFAGELGAHEAGRVLDEGILHAVWLTPEEIRASAERHRSPLVWQCVSDWLAGRRFPLDLIRHYD